MNEFKKLAQEIRDEQRMREIKRKHHIPLLDFALIILVILLAVDLAYLTAGFILSYFP